MDAEAIRQEVSKFLRLNTGDTLVIRVEEGDGEKTVQRMRVFMSRLRNKAKKVRRSIRPFKMLCESIKHEGHQDVITLRMGDRETSSIDRIMREVEQDFPIATGKRSQINVDEYLEEDGL